MKTTEFADHFSGHAGDYDRYRPAPPPELGEWLAGVAERHGLAWDCATGNGQAAAILTPHFERVLATDASIGQLARAPQAGAGACAVCLAESSALGAGTADLVTVSQALHWFDLKRFYGEVRRVVRPGGLVAVWCYPVFRLDEVVDRAVDELYERVREDWPAERLHVMDGYRRLPFPFDPVEAPEFEMDAEWTLGDCLGYVSTWSGVRRFRERTGVDPVGLVSAVVAAGWGSGRRRVRWPLTLRVGRVDR